jgi:propanol-preferring alcohol dehydrogenase
MLSGETLVVFGLGPVGMAALLMGESMGYRCVGVDISAYRLDLAKRLSGGNVLDASEVDPVQVVKDLTEGKGAQGVLECSGSGAARTQTAALAARHGTVVVVGAGDKDITFTFTDILRKALTIRGNAVFSMSAYFDTVEFLQQNEVPLENMVTHRFTVDQGVEAFQLFDTGQTGKVIFEWE